MEHVVAITRIQRYTGLRTTYKHQVRLSRNPIHTIADAAAQIAQGEDPWFALGNFLHDWWCYAVDVRAGVSTHQVGRSAQTLMGVAPRASAGESAQPNIDATI